MAIRNTTNRSRAFTLIELIVVIGIIVLLVAILIPAIGKVRSTSRVTATTVQMRSISLACDNYYILFNAYPGAISETTGGYGDGTVTTFSSSQALVVSLTRAFFTGDQSAAVPPVLDIHVAGPNPAFWVATDASVSPRDYSTGGAGGKTYEPFLNPKMNELSSSIGLQSTADNGVLAAVPTFVDAAYGNEALPILYYRAARKYDASVANLVQVTNSLSTNVNAGFYTEANDWLGQPVVTAAGSAFSSSGISKLKGNATALASMLFNSNGSAKGAYVLISAGPDRLYGPDPKQNIDDIIVAGGN